MAGRHADCQFAPAATEFWHRVHHFLGDIPHLLSLFLHMLAKLDVGAASLRTLGAKHAVLDVPMHLAMARSK